MTKVQHPRDMSPTMQHAIKLWTGGKPAMENALNFVDHVMARHQPKTNLQKQCELAANEIGDFVDRFTLLPGPVNRQELAAIIYKHVHGGTTL